MNPYYIKRRMTRRNRIRLADNQARTNLANFAGSLLAVGIFQPAPQQVKEVLDKSAKEFLASLLVALWERR
jgi:hypothetical protein